MQLLQVISEYGHAVQLQNCDTCAEDIIFVHAEASAYAHF